MTEVKSQEDIQLFKYYVVRNNILYLINRYDIIVGEQYCLTANTPWSPTEIVLFRSRRGDSQDPFYAFDPTERVVNMEYYNPEGIKNYILDKGPFKNWWETGEAPKTDELQELAKILKDALNKKR